MFDWDDLKFLLAVGREGSTLAAGRALGVDQSTVQRRLAELERRLGVVIARREAKGYRLTESGQAILANAQRVEEAVLAIARLQASSASPARNRWPCGSPAHR
jgi:DNA-binding transcriptional LysR family regulator